jgi:hypothetical protein
VQAANQPSALEARLRNVDRIPPVAPLPVPPTRRRRILRIAAAAGLAFGLAALAAAAPRIVAVGDVHGDLAGFKKILVEAGVIDGAGAWVGGDTVLVQVGDLIDRGPSMRGTLDFVMALEAAAPKQGGRVVALLGNHESLNLAGDLRYVTPGNYAEFADAGSEKRREEAWAEVRDLRLSRAKTLGEPEPPTGPDAKKAWLDAHPPGYLEHQEAFGPRGVYGRWLRTRPAIFVAQDTAFLHGGLSPAMAGASLADLNRKVADDLATLDSDRALFVSEKLILPFFDIQETFRALRAELEALDRLPRSGNGAERRRVYEHFLDWGSWTMNSPDGPLWFRGYATWSDGEGGARMPALLASAGVQRFVVGHTIQKDGRIHVRFGGAVFLIDSGMLNSYASAGRASALELVGGVANAIYPGEPRRVIWEPVRKAADASSVPAGLAPRPREARPAA